MENKTARIVYAACQGGALGMLAVAITRVGSNSMGKNCIFFSIGILLFVIAEIVFRKFKLGGRINPNIRNPKMISFLTRYPFLARVLPMAIGIFIMVVCLHFLDAA